MSYYYDKQGQPITREEWADLHGDVDYCRVGSTHVGRWWVSTVWLGLNHALSWPGHDGSILIFETMVFDQSDDKHKWHDLEQERYTTEKQALCGHYRMVATVRGWDDPSTKTKEDQ